MKTIKTILLILCLAGISNVSNAQIRLGPLVAFGTDTDLGLGVKAKFDLNDKFKISPSIIYLGGDKETIGASSVKSSFIEINGDVHYAFSETESVLFYGIGGLNIITGSVKISGTGIIDGKTSDTDVGLNLGAGAEFGIADKFDAFAEAKFGVGGAEQLLISAGGYFAL